MKKTIISIALSLFVGFNMPCMAHKTIGITQIVEHPSLDKIRDGFTEVMKESFGNDVSIVYESAHGNLAIAAQIAQKFAGMDLDLIVPISTPSAQAVLNAAPDTPVLFVAVSDPEAANIVELLEEPGGNKTGVMDMPPVEEQLEFITELFPSTKKIGYPYNPGEANSDVVLRKLKVLAEKKGIAIIPTTVSKSADMGIAAQFLVGKADVIFISTDNTVVSGLEALIKVCNQHHIPLFASDPDSVDRGAYAAIAYDQKHIGEVAGNLAIRILKGEKPGKIPVQRPFKMVTKINSDVGVHLGLPRVIEDNK